MKYLLILLSILGGIYYAKISSNKLISPVPSSYTQKSNYSIVPVAQAKETDNPGSKEILYEIIRVFDGEDIRSVISILNCAYGESRLNPNAIHINKNGTRDYNIFQINDVHVKKYGDKFKYSWKENIKVAHDLYKKQGFKPWYSPRCKKI